MATAFTIEALELVDHYNFLDSLSKKTPAAPGAQPPPPPADKQAAAAAGWFLDATTTGPRNTSTPTIYTPSTASCSAAKPQQPAEYPPDVMEMQQSPAR